jgi:acetyl esterase
MKKRLLIILIFLVAIIFLAFNLSHYPSVWVIRYAFNKEAIRVNKELEKFVPANIETISNLHYNDADSDAFLDVYFHKDSVKKGRKLPIIVWTHGGGLISGDRSQVELIIVKSWPQRAL